VLQDPLSMPCGHNFCKACLDARFAGQATSVVGGSGYKTLRARKVRAAASASPGPCSILLLGPTSALDPRRRPPTHSYLRPGAPPPPPPPRPRPTRQVPKPCPTCKTEIGDFLSHAAVNREMQQVGVNGGGASRRAAACAFETAGRMGRFPLRALRHLTRDATRCSPAPPRKPPPRPQVIDKLKAAADEARAAAEEMAGGAKKEDGEEGEDEGAEEEGDDEEVEEAGGDAGPSTSAPAGKPAKPTPDASKGDAASKAPEAGPEAASAGGAPAAAAPAPAAAAAAPSEPASRYSVELAELQSSFPDFDAGLILGMLEDQGGDAVEVAAYLKVGVGRGRGRGGGAEGDCGVEKGRKAGGRMAAAAARPPARPPRAATPHAPFLAPRPRPLSPAQRMKNQLAYASRTKASPAKGKATKAAPAKRGRGGAKKGGKKAAAAAEESDEVEEDAAAAAEGEAEDDEAEAGAAEEGGSDDDFEAPAPKRGRKGKARGAGAARGWVEGGSAWPGRRGHQPALSHLQPFPPPRLPRRL
jgi:hypothetical protein